MSNLRGRVCMDVGENLARHDDADENQIVERKDPENASRVKAGEVVLGVPRINQDPSNEKSGKNKEQVNTYPALPNVTLEIEAGYV